MPPGFSGRCACDDGCACTDGERIAFASNKTGSWDIYVMSAKGGKAEKAEKAEKAAKAKDVDATPAA